MEFEINCNRCKSTFFIVQLDYSKSAHPCQLEKIDFKRDTHLDLSNNKMTFKCPNCQNELSIDIEDLPISLYILYTTDIEFSKNLEANNILDDIRKEVYSSNNTKLKQLLKQLYSFNLRILPNKNLSNLINENQFKQAIKTILDSII